MDIFRKIYNDLSPYAVKTERKYFADDEYQAKVRLFVEDYAKNKGSYFPGSLRNVDETMDFLASLADRENDWDVKTKLYPALVQLVKSYNEKKPLGYFLSIIPSTEIITDRDTAVLFSLKKKVFQIINKRHLSIPFITKTYSIDDVMAYELLVNHVVSSSNSRRAGTALVGGLLFGPVGAIVGAMSSPTKTQEKNNYSVQLSINDMELASIEIPCSSRQLAHRVLATFSVFEKTILENSDRTIN